MLSGRASSTLKRGRGGKQTTGAALPAAPGEERGRRPGRWGRSSAARSGRLLLPRPRKGVSRLPAPCSLPVRLLLDVWSAEVCR